MKYKIQANDIPVLAKIFNPTADLVFVLTNLESVEYYKKIQDNLDCDIQFFTEEIVLKKALEQEQARELIWINLKNKLTLNWVTSSLSNVVIIDFSTTINISSKPIFEFDFINNRDNTIRWIYEANHQKPIFLNLYNSSGWKGQLFKAIFKIGFSLKLKKWLKSGGFRVIAKQLFLDKINQRLKDAQYAVFTGTVGVNRKAVISYEAGGKATQFLKMPLTKKVQKLVNKEAFYLTELQNYTFEKLAVPAAKKIENSVMVSNVKPNKPLINNDLSETHLLALKELYHQTIVPIILQNSPMWELIKADLDAIAKADILNDLPKNKIQNIHTQLSILVDQFDGVDALPMAITHGDLTPWNSYLSKEKLHVYDWELAERLPLLYDAFHFTFQTSILVERLPFTAIQTKLNNLEQDPIIQAILSNFEVDFQQAYHFYLLRNTSYYLRRYMQQQDLHMQAHWLVNMWEMAINDVCKKLPIAV